MVQVSFSTSTDFSGEENALIENEGTALTFNFELDEPAPVGGLTLFVDGDKEQILNRLDLPSFAFNPTTENIAFESIVPNRDSSGFVLTIDEGATFATVTLNVFDNTEPDTFLPETFDGLVSATFSLLTESQIDRDIEGPIPTLSDFTVDSASATSVVLFADNISQLPGSTNTPEPGIIQVSLFTGPNYLIEDEGTVSAHAFNVTNGIIPEGGLVVAVDAPNLREFDLAGVSVEGGEIVAVRDGGFDLRMTEYTTLVNLPIADDGETEAGETASFTLAAAEGYEIIEDYSGGTFNLVDTRDDIPQGVINEPNDILAEATDTQISPENPTFFGTDAIYFDIGNRYLNPDGTYTYIDYSEDVDVFKVELKAGDTISVETFDFDTNVDEFGVGFAINSFIYDADGNQLRDYIITGFDAPAAPDKLFGGIGPFDENETDSYDEFTAPEDGTYFIALGGDGQVQNFWEEVAPFYEPFTPGSGNGNRAIFGNYSIEINLLTEDNPRKTGTPTPPVSNPGITNPPTLSLSANPTTTDGEGNFTNAVVEHVDVGGLSTVTFTIQAGGEVPEEGIEFVLNSNVNLFDYVSYLGQNVLPSTIGGQSLGAYYNEDGIPTGIRLLIDEPLMTITYEAANNQPWFPTFYGNIVDAYEPLETDGPEDVTFFLQPGEGYEIDPDAATASVTYYDSVADVPPPTEGNIIPEVAIAISESTLIETEQTETTLTFTLSEPPPPEGLTIFVDSEDETVVGSPLSQFAVLEAQVSGGNFPVPNGDSSGFFFTITEQTATITLSAFDELTVPGIDPQTVQEGIVSLNFALQPLAGYTIAADASEINLTIADNPDSGIQVSLTGEPDTLVESEGTASVHTFSLSTPPPPEGLTVSVSAPSLDEFDLDTIAVTGGTIAAVRNDGFDFTITEQTATISLPVLNDGVDEGSETATFSLEPRDTYELNAAFNQASFTIVDTLDQATVPEESELIGDEISNSTLLEANTLGLSLDNPFVSINGLIAESFSDLPEDVDFYSFELEAGQTVSLDIDTEESLVDGVINFRSVVYPALSSIFQTFDTELRLFDAQGNELAANNDGAAPGEDFSRDPYLEYTAQTAGTYYVGVSQLGNRNYDPFTARSGSGWTFPEIGVFNGFYELTATLAEDDNPPDVPIISFSVDKTLISEEDDDASFTTITTVDGEIPEVVFDADGNYVSGGLPILIGSVADTLAFNGEISGRTGEGAVLGSFLDFEADVYELVLLQNTVVTTNFIFNDVIEEVDQDYTFFIVEDENGVLGSNYTFDPDTAGFTVTLTDGIVPTDDPTVGITVTETELMEGDEFTVNFTVEGDNLPTPENPLTVLVDSGILGAIGEFAIFDEAGNPAVEFEGIAEFPEVNGGSASGFLVDIIDTEASITLSVFDDGPGEGLEEFSFSVIDGEVYEVDADAAEITFTIDDSPSFSPVFGSIEGDVIEVEGSNQLVFAGALGDLIDASIASEGGNRLYGSSGDDIFILGAGDRLVGGEGDDKFFTISDGNNTITGGAGVDQFWIATAEIPDAANIITDFTSGEDVLGIAGLGIGFEDLTITQQDDNTLIAASGSDLAILQGIAADSLMADNFAFA